MVKPDPNTDGYERRFERMESTLESPTIAHAATAAAQEGTTVAQAKIERYLAIIAVGLAKLRAAQDRTDLQLAALAAEHAKTEIAMQATQGKLDALIVVDNLIRERGRHNGGSKGDAPIG